MENRGAAPSAPHHPWASHWRGKRAVNAWPQAVLVRLQLHGLRPAVVTATDRALTPGISVRVGGRALAAVAQRKSTGLSRRRLRGQHPPVAPPPQQRTCRWPREGRQPRSTRGEETAGGGSLSGRERDECSHAARPLPVAQRTERLAPNEEATGSIPVGEATEGDRQDEELAR